MAKKFGHDTELLDWSFVADIRSQKVWKYFTLHLCDVTSGSSVNLSRTYLNIKKNNRIDYDDVIISPSVPDVVSVGGGRCLVGLPDEKH